ncbi:hypothetical protein C1H76_3535 [Elsinoe australis]|uniref:Uncharacterized protein n=1 Tax=Elsinoe australis TaxID=40998 RepID=A0A4V6DUE1_9PEZI|nr:hypothetical protein C1H76_3535 [Elsinoe australis]
MSSSFLDFDTSGLTLHRQAVLRRTFQVHSDALERLERSRVDLPGEDSDDSDDIDFYDVEIELPANTEHHTSTESDHRECGNGTFIFEDPDNTMDDSRGDTQDFGSIDVIVPSYIAHADAAALRIHETSLQKYIACRDLVLSLVPMLDGLISYINFPEVKVTTKAAKALRSPLAKIHNLKDDLALMQTGADLHSLLLVIQAGIAGSTTAEIPRHGFTNDSSEDAEMADSVTGAGADKEDTEMTDAGNGNSKTEKDLSKLEAYTFVHLPTNKDPLSCLEGIYEIVNHEYAFLINGPLKKGTELHKSMLKLNNDPSFDAVEELQESGFPHKFLEWHKQWQSVWFGLGGELVGE